MTTCLKREREEVFQKVCSEDVILAMEICKKQHREKTTSSRNSTEGENNENTLKLEKNKILGKTTRRFVLAGFV